MTPDYSRKCFFQIKKNERALFASALDWLFQPEADSDSHLTQAEEIPEFLRNFRNFSLLSQSDPDMDAVERNVPDCG